MSLERYLSERLAALKATGRLRDATPPVIGSEVLDAASNDYLGRAGARVSRETETPLGAGASRLIHGTTASHLDLEADLAAWVSAPAALLFSSGYAANLGLIAALFSQGGVLISDQANHASIIDGCRLSKAEVRIVPHLDLSAVEAALQAPRKLSPTALIIESYFSMDGDGPDLHALRTLCDRYGAFLLVDEAHALGVFGPAGGGRCRAAGIAPDALVAGLGKAIGGHGGFVAGSVALRELLWNSARSFVFSTATSPLLCQHLRAQVSSVRRADSERAQLVSNCDRIRKRLEAQGIELAAGSFGPIIPVVIGANDRALTVSARLTQLGIRNQAIRPPTVPEGSARLRLTAKSWFTLADIERLTEAVVRACRE